MLFGLPGCISIHDNILVCCKTLQGHETNLVLCLRSIREKGLTLCRSKSIFDATSVLWFDYIFSEASMSAERSKIKAITQAGKPTTTEKVKGFLQVCQYNTKFMFDLDKAYAQATQPLQQLISKNVEFEWTATSGELRPGSKPSSFAYVKTANIFICSCSE